MVFEINIPPKLTQVKPTTVIYHKYVAEDIEEPDICCDLLFYSLMCVDIGLCVDMDRAWQNCCQSSNK